MNENTISSNLTRIKDATDDIRSTLGTPGAAIEDVASDVATLSTQYNQMASDYNDLIIENNRLRQQITDLTPKGTINITQNGNVNVTQYANASVNVSGGGHQDIYKVSSLEALYNLPDSKAGDLGVIISNQEDPLTNDFTGGIIHPVTEVVYDKPITEWSDLTLSFNNGNGEFDISLGPDEARISCFNQEEDSSVELYYFTEDSQHYVLEGQSEDINISSPVSITNFNENNAKLVITTRENLNGIYKCVNTSVCPFDTLGGKHYTYISQHEGGTFGNSLLYNIENDITHLVTFTAISSSGIFYVQNDNLYCYNPNNFGCIVWKYDNPADFEISSNGEKLYTISPGRTQLILSNIELSNMAFVSTFENNYLYDSDTLEHSIATAQVWQHVMQNVWSPFNIGINTSSDALVPGLTMYTNNGVVTGTFGESINRSGSHFREYFGIVTASIPNASALETNFTGYFMNQPNEFVMATSPLLNTTNAIWFNQMFSNTNITWLNLSNFNTANVEQYNYMFSNCKQLESLDISSFTIKPNVNISLNNMFSDCVSLRKIDMRNLEFTANHNIANMFKNVPTTCLIIVKDNTVREYLLSQFSTMTNIKTVAEYEGGNE